MEKKLLAIIQLVIGYEWFSSSISKVLTTHAEFTTEILGSFTKFASKNPYAFYKSFLLDFAIPSKEIFSWIIPWGEFLAGSVLLVGAAMVLFGVSNKYLKAVSLVALGGAAFMNLNFWFAAGWMSPSTAGLNLLMGLIEVILIVAWVKVFTKNK